MKTNTFQYKVIFEQDEDGIFIADVPSLPGCHSFGVTLEEAEINVREAILGHIEALQKAGDSVPEPDDSTSSTFVLTKLIQITPATV